MEACAVCGATWGNVWAEIRGRRYKFC
ncbi:MAG: TA0938 family protein [Firmicutes bacterium]|nr:TA0938 family protein [Bacillota bacterium]